MQIGSPVPDFSVPATSQTCVQRSALSGYQLLLYFYPKNNTPACTIENQDFAANYQRFRQHQTLIFGVSRDSLEAHESFKESLALPFELISDQEGVLCKLFNVLYERELFGKSITSVERSTFLLAADGTLLKEWRRVKVTNHVHEVIDFIEASGRPSHQKTG